MRGIASVGFAETRLSKRKSTDGAVAAEAASVVAEAAAKRGRRPAAGGKSPSVGTSAVPHAPEAPCNGHAHHPSRSAYLPVHRESDAETKEAIIRSEIPKSVVKVGTNHPHPWLWCMQQPLQQSICMFFIQLCVQL